VLNQLVGVFEWGLLIKIHGDYRREFDLLQTSIEWFMIIFKHGVIRRKMNNY